MFPSGSIIVATSATIGEHALINVDFLCNQRFTVLILKDEFKNLLSPKFLYYYSFVLDRWCLANTTQSSFASVDMKRFKKFEFPVPPWRFRKRLLKFLTNSRTWKRSWKRVLCNTSTTVIHSSKPSTAPVIR